MITYLLISYAYMIFRCIFGYAREGEGKEWFKLFLIAPLSLPVIVVIDLVNW